NRRVSENDIGRTRPEPVRPPPAPPPPAPVKAAPVVVPSNTVKITVVRNGETKEYEVQRTNGGTDGKRTRANWRSAGRQVDLRVALGIRTPPRLGSRAAHNAR